MTDDDRPLPRPPRVVAHPLLTWDVTELEQYVTELRAEIVRAEAAIERKRGHRNAADAFFRRPDPSGP